MATIQKTTLKRFNGTDFDPIFLATSGDITQVGETFQVMGEGMGTLKPGDTVNATDMVTSTLKKMLQKQIPPVYTQPSLAFTAAKGTGEGENFKAGAYEAGTKINVAMTATGTQNDGGAITAMKINDGKTDVVDGTDNPSNYQYEGTLEDGGKTFTASYAYADGPIKNDNFDQPYPTGQIKAGTKTQTLKYTTFRRYFYGADSTGKVAIADSAGIRALTPSSGGAQNGTKITITVPKGSTRCTIAYDATIRDLTSVLYRESGNANITGQFKKSEVQVEGANGYNAKAYKVFTVLWAQPSASGMTFDVTI